jgi:hypothetical protein
MRIPVLISIVIIFILWLNYEIRKNTRHTKEDTERFWKREQASNQVRRTDISDLSYIIISTEQLPLADNPDDTINAYRNTILSLKDKKAINLSGFTNTDLKLRYGTANINKLIEYDNNYITLVSILQKWADRLYLQGNIADSRSVLEYAVSCCSDVPKTYKLLADIYRQENQPDKINLLIHLIPKTRIPDKVSLTGELKAIKNS